MTKLSEISKRVQKINAMAAGEKSLRVVLQPGAFEAALQPLVEEIRGLRRQVSEQKMPEIPAPVMASQKEVVYALDELGSKIEAAMASAKIEAAKASAKPAERKRGGFKITNVELNRQGDIVSAEIVPT